LSTTNCGRRNGGKEPAGEKRTTKEAKKKFPRRQHYHGIQILFPKEKKMVRPIRWLETQSARDRNGSKLNKRINIAQWSCASMPGNLRRRNRKGEGTVWKRVGGGAT